MLTISCDTTNAAFEGDALRTESARILRALADRIEAGEDFRDHATVRDVNGNRVGTVRLKPCNCSHACDCDAPELCACGNPVEPGEGNYCSECR